MHTYCYGGHKPGEPIVDWDSLSMTPPVSVFANGMVLSRNYQAEQCSRSAANPWVEHFSIAMGVNILDIENAKKHYMDRHGMQVDFHPQTGAMKMDSVSHQRQICDVDEVVNNDSYFG